MRPRRGQDAGPASCKAWYLPPADPTQPAPTRVAAPKQRVAVGVSHRIHAQVYRVWDAGGARRRRRALLPCRLGGVAAAGQALRGAGRGGARGCQVGGPVGGLEEVVHWLLLSGRFRRHAEVRHSRATEMVQELHPSHRWAVRPMPPPPPSPPEGPGPAAGPATAPARATHTCGSDRGRRGRARDGQGPAPARCRARARVHHCSAASRVAGRPADRFAEQLKLSSAHFLAVRTAVDTSAPLASSAAIAEASVQPVPCVLPVLRGRRAGARRQRSAGGDARFAQQRQQLPAGAGAQDSCPGSSPWLLHRQTCPKPARHPLT